mgnify:CR=1 FL=1
MVFALFPLLWSCKDSTDEGSATVKAAPIEVTFTPPPTRPFTEESIANCQDPELAQILSDAGFPDPMGLPFHYYIPLGGLHAGQIQTPYRGWLVSPATPDKNAMVLGLDGVIFPVKKVLGKTDFPEIDQRWNQNESNSPFRLLYSYRRLIGDGVSDATAAKRQFLGYPPESYLHQTGWLLPRSWQPTGAPDRDSKELAC